MSSAIPYLDHHATTPVDPAVVGAMRPFLEADFGNAASISHEYGWRASEAVEQSREAIAASLGVSLRTIVFTSGATESNNIAIKGVMRAAGSRRHLIVNNIEHRSVLDPAKQLRREGFEVSILRVDEYGFIAPEQVREAIRPDTALVSLMLVNNEIGTVNDLSEIAALCRARETLLHCDAAQAIGRVAVSPEELGIDLLSLSGHKVYGPKGVGALYVRDRDVPIAIEPLVHGGGHENGLRSGTLPVPLLVGLAKAVEIAVDRRECETARIRSMRDRLWNALSREIPNVLLNGHPHQRVSENLNICFQGIDGDVLMNEITQIAVSAGSACSSADPSPSHVLRGIGRTAALAKASLRIGIGRFNTDADIDVAIRHIREAVAACR